MAASLITATGALTALGAPSFDSNLTMHERAKIVAQRAIQFLSNPVSKDFKPLQEELDLSQDDKDRIQRLCLDSYDKLISSDLKEVDGFIAIGKGHHAQVYTHQEYPHLVFRFESDESAKKQVDASARAIRLVNRNGLYFYEIPPATSVPLPGKTNYFQKPMAVHVSLLVPIPFGGDTQADVMSRILIHYLNGANDTFKANVQEIARQGAEIIGEISYWDIQHGNGPQFSLDGTRVILIDFENIEVYPQKAMKKQGFQQLSRMFSIPEITKIVHEVAFRTSRLTSKDLNDPYQDKRSLSELTAAQTALKSYDEKGMTNVAHATPISIPNPELISDPEVLAAANEIVAILNIELNNNKESPKTPLTKARVAYFSPTFLFKFRGCENQIVLKALEALKAQGVLISVSGENEYASADRDPQFYTYKLYF